MDNGYVQALFSGYDLYANYTSLFVYPVERPASRNAKTWKLGQVKSILRAGILVHHIYHKKNNKLWTINE